MPTNWSRVGGIDKFMRSFRHTLTCGQESVYAESCMLWLGEWLHWSPILVTKWSQHLREKPVGHPSLFVESQVLAFQPATCPSGIDQGCTYAKLLKLLLVQADCLQVWKQSDHFCFWSELCRLLVLKTLVGTIPFLRSCDVCLSQVLTEESSPCCTVWSGKQNYISVLVLQHHHHSTLPKAFHHLGFEHIH